MRNRFSGGLCLLFFVGALITSDASAQSSEPGSLDKVPIEALETYKNPQNHLFSVGGAIYPFDPYHFNFCVSAFYTYYFGRTWGWEILNGAYAFSVRKELMDQLAAEFGKSAEDRTEQIQYVISSNLSYTLLYGKNILFENYIRHYRMMLLFGPGVINTSQHEIAPTANLGLRLEQFITDWASWTLDIRNTIAFTREDEEFENYLGFNLGLAVSL
jgi:outer membrane beta-barrel protein